jgi:stalled ribosome rescue protein Dom34
MKGHYHAAVWIDHRQARVFYFNTDEWESEVVHSAHGKGHHPSQDTHGEHEFLEKVAHALADAGAVLVMGPSGEKTELVKHIEKAHPQLGKRIEGVEAADHPSDGEIVAHARRVLKSADRMRPQL